MATNSTVSNYGLTVATADVFNSPAGVDQVFTTNNRGDQRVAQSLPPLAELVRMGKVWDVAIATGSAFTYVAAWPTTRAELVVHNTESAGGTSLVWLSAWVYNITSMAASQPITLIAQNVPVVATAPTDAKATHLMSNRNGNNATDNLVSVAVANTAAGQTTNLWRVLAPSLVPSPTTNLGAAVWADLAGGFITRPGGVMAFNAVAGTAAGTAIIGATYARVQLPLG